MKVAVEDLESCKRRLVVEAPADVVSKEWERAYDRVQKQARLPVFRKGHVPRSLVKVHFADDVRREVAQHLIPDVYRQALAEVQLDPVNEPDLQDVQLAEGAPLTFSAIVEIKPDIALGDVKGIEVEQTPAPVTGPEVDQTLDRMREQQAEFRNVERTAGPGDLVIVNYTLTVDGEQPMQQSGYAFMVGDGSVMPEVDHAVAGMRTGEQHQVSFRLPDDYRQEALRGKSGKGEVMLVEVKEKILPELNDDFARSLGEFTTLEALRVEVVKQLEARRASEERHALEEKLVDALLGRQAFGVPESMIMRQIAHQVEHARERMRRQGVDPDGVQWDVPKLIGELRPGAERAVRRGLLLDAVAAREGIAPTDATVEAEVEKLAQASQRPAPAVRRMMEKSGDLEGLRQALRERMTLEFLVNHATIRS
ncbi:MAG: trigger factor [Candidatus Rokuibacteriota bacterium]|nr:MAG: trigger factor [Candidatus Rokubacteria bacterium]